MKLCNDDMDKLKITLQVLKKSKLTKYSVQSNIKFKY